MRDDLASGAGAAFDRRLRVISGLELLMPVLPVQ
jgi:hypothetical protein